MSSQETNYNSSSSEDDATLRKPKAKQILTAEQKERNRLYSREYRQRKSTEDPNFYRQDTDKKKKYQQTYLEKKTNEDPDFAEKRRTAQREATKRMYAKYKDILNAVKHNQLVPSV